MKVIVYPLIKWALLSAALVVAQSAIAAATNERLPIPDGQSLLLSAKGVGHQIYKSQLKSGSTTEFEWVLKEPRAKLIENSHEEIGKHYLGPTWESKDGSTVVGKLKQSVPAPKAGNIPWLLVEAATHDGREGLFSKVSYILRIDTVGGIAAAYPPTELGQEKQVPYEATYVFLVPASIK